MDSIQEPYSLTVLSIKYAPINNEKRVQGNFACKKVMGNKEQKQFHTIDYKKLFVTIEEHDV